MVSVIKSLFKATICCLSEVKMNLIHFFLLAVDISIALLFSHKYYLLYHFNSRKKKKLHRLVLKKSYGLKWRESLFPQPPSRGNKINLWKEKLNEILYFKIKLNSIGNNSPIGLLFLVKNLKTVQSLLTQGPVCYNTVRKKEVWVHYHII